MTQRLLLLCLIAAAFAQAGYARAQEPEPTVYRVEVIVLEQANPFAAGEVFDLEEKSVSDATGTPGENTFSDTTGIDAVAPEYADESLPELTPLSGDFEQLGADEFTLGQTARRLTNASRFKVLGHFAWSQEALDPGEALPFAVSSALTDGRVNGTILLSRSRYLRLDTDLTYTNGDVTVDLNQSRRRVQTGKLHYFDHPYFGLIVQVSREVRPSSDASDQTK